MLKIALFFFGGALILYLGLWILSIRVFTPTYGISFSHTYATFLGLDWRKAYSDILQDLKPKTIRLALHWDEAEPRPGIYAFEDMDWMMEEAAKHNAKVLLVVGQKAPRWPECYIPKWLDEYSDEEKEERLLRYIQVAVERYKNNPALEYWQVENEPFIHFTFGECEGFRHEAVFREVDLVRQIDPSHPVVLTDSGELSTWRSASKFSDILGTTLYRVVATPKGSVISYDWFPASVYRLRARLWHKDYDHFFVTELQAEPWFTHSIENEAGLSVHKTFSEKRMQKNIAYSARVGASRVYLWGVEWWYFQKEMHGNGVYWEIAREALKR